MPKRPDQTHIPLGNEAITSRQQQLDIISANERRYEKQNNNRITKKITIYYVAAFANVIKLPTLVSAVLFS